jgi:hypothetical protein
MCACSTDRAKTLARSHLQCPDGSTRALEDPISACKCNDPSKAFGRGYNGTYGCYSCHEDATINNGVCVGVGWWLAYNSQILNPNHKTQRVDKFAMCCACAGASAMVLETASTFVGSARPTVWH